MRSHQLRQTSICQFSSTSWSLVEDLARYENYDIGSIGVWERKIRENDVEYAIDTLFESKLNVSSLHWVGGFTGADGRLEDTLSDALETIRLAARIGADCVLVHPGSVNGHIFNHINKVVSSKLMDILSIANDYGVQLAIEPVFDQPHSPWTIYQTLDQYIELLDTHPGLGVNLDMYHVGLYEEAFDRLDEFVDRVKLVQMADRTFDSLQRSQKRSNRRHSYRLPLGEGDIAFETWISRLTELGYAGKYEIEIHGLTVPRDHFQVIEDATEFMSCSDIQQALTAKSDKNSVPTKQRNSVAD